MRTHDIVRGSGRQTFLEDVGGIATGGTATLTDSTVGGNTVNCMADDCSNVGIVTELGGDMLGTGCNMLGSGCAAATVTLAGD